MINNNLQFDHELFRSLYNRLIKEEVPSEYEGHEWIDIDDVIRRSNYLIRNHKKEQKK